VTLQNVLDRAKRYLRSKRPSTPERGQFTAQEARENRASSVTALRHEVRRIQQEITDLNALQESGTAGGNSTANESRMAALQDELARKQKELAKFQARV
jgi:predicted lipid-binding transport protein (Tim44 family)